MEKDHEPQNAFTWSNVSLSVGKKAILQDSFGSAKPGEIVALMGPSGCGKTTLLNTLAQRSIPKSTVTGEIKLDGHAMNPTIAGKACAYVEQEDSLIGSLTVRETIDFSAKLCGLSNTQQRKERVNELLEWFGLVNEGNLTIGTPVQKGISGGQKRRVSVASQLIQHPKVLFLDEPTSGLDSKASYETIAQIKRIAKAENMIVLASIHQPSSSTFYLFDRVAFLSRGKMVYFGEVQSVPSYFEQQNLPIPAGYNPAEYILDLINDDFASNVTDVASIQSAWAESNELSQLKSQIDDYNQGEPGEIDSYSRQVNTLTQTWILLQRLFVKSRRDLLAYYVRIVMYMGLAILTGTVWLRLAPDQQNIQPLTNSIFFSGAFMSFMAVAYIPAYLEDFAAFKKDRLNGLYGPTAYMLSNFIMGLPFLFAISILFAVVTYFMVNFRHSAQGFFMYTMWLFLDLVAAESLVVLVSSILPIFVVALAITAFANGLWMSVGGFLVPANVLNVFWYYTFYWIDYQRYVFQGMMFNEFNDRVYNCDSDCHCMYVSPLNDQCQIDGGSVLKNMGYGSERVGEWVGILIAIIFVYRLAAWVWLRFKK